MLTVVYTSSHVDRQIMAILLEPIKLELDASDTQMGFLVGLTFALFYATLGMPIAMLADRRSRRNIITAAVTVWSGMTVACGYVGSFFQLALARIGVAVGEAGSTPPSHSIIADLFPISERGAAMGIYALGVNFGLLIAYLAGGWLSEHYGWRTTFVVVGLPGLAIALLVYFTTVEPRRGAADQRPDHDRSTAAADTVSPRFREVATYLFRIPSVRHIMAGCALAGFVGYGMVLWLPSFFFRSHGLAPTEVGLILALMTGVVGGLGTYAAGKLADVLARRDERWRAWIVAIGKAALVPFLVAFFLLDDLAPALVVYLVPAFFGGFYLAPSAALVQNLVGLRMRALASAIMLFLLNIIGMGIGPQGVGILSDLFAPRFGDESLRYALLIFSLVNLWCAAHYLLAARTLTADGEQARRLQLAGG
jgi:MFS family permease